MSGEAMLERMAYAICVRRCGFMGWKTSTSWTASKREYLAEAKAALLAIREPSEDQMDRACEIGPDTNNGPFSYDDARAVWVSMVNSILNESPSPSVTHQTGDKP